MEDAVGDVGTVESGSVAPDTSASPVTTPTTPTARDFSDDDLVRVPGQKDPVRYGDLYKRLQSDYTRKTQAAAKREAELAKREEATKSQESYLKNLAATLLAKQNAGVSSQKEDNLLAKLEQLQYLDGKTAAQMLREIQSKGFGPIVQAIQDRDTIIQQLHQRALQHEQLIRSLMGRHADTEFDGKIKRWLNEGGYPPEAIDLAKEIYTAYEGDDLDEEFPGIFQKRWNQIQTILRNQDKAKVEAAKKRPFQFPTKGGNGTASKPIGLKGNESPSEVADQLWEALSGGRSET